MIGRLLGGRYEIVDNIDSGGMAYVYKAICKKTNTVVAVKVLKEKFSGKAEYVKRFKKEAEAAFSLDHHHIVHVTDIGYDQGVYYMVMEYIEGSSIKTLIEQNGLIEEKEAVSYAIQVCSALAAAHKKGIIHRDIKPQNILLDQEGDAKVTDFGIAQSLSGKEQEESQVIGSVYYISPEQAKGDKVDQRTDIYSLGIMLYEMLTGVLPYTGDETIAVALKHIHEQIIAPIEKNSSISQSINNIVLKATAKNKKDRYQSMSQMKEDLVRALVEPDGSFVEVLPNHMTGLKKSVAGRKNKIWRTSILVGLLIVVAFVVVIGTSALISSGQKLITLPDSVGLDVESATQQLNNKKLVLSITYESSEAIENGIVISQTPEAGSRISSGSEVVLTVSSGPAGLVMPDVYNMGIEEAEALVESMGLVVEDITYEIDDDISVGNVITQMPEAGSAVAESDVVSFVVSGEEVQNTAALPQLTGIMLDQAASLLKDAGFTNCFVYEEESELEEGTVIGQSPEQGIRALTSDIDLRISQYTSKGYMCHLAADIEIPEKDSKVKIVLQENVDSCLVNFVVWEPKSDAGMLSVDLDIDCLYGGTKTIKIFINNTETDSIEVQSFEVDVVEQSALDEG